MSVLGLRQKLIPLLSPMPLKMYIVVFTLICKQIIFYTTKTSQFNYITFGIRTAMLS